MKTSSRVIFALLICFSLAACGPPEEPRLNDELSQWSPPAQAMDRGSLVPPSTVILIVIDTLRADHFGIYNPENQFTPAIDAFAREGIVFDAMYASASWTRPSIASIFTSRYPSEINVVGKEDALADEFLTVAEVLSENGFATLGINTNSNSAAVWNLDQGFEHYGPPEMVQWKRVKGRPKYQAQRVSRELLHWLDQRDDQRPAFVYALYVDPHGPYFRYPELMERPEPDGRFDGAVRSELARLDWLTAEQRTREDEERIKWLYESEVRNTDVALSELFDGLKARGLYDDSLIIVTADHGEELWQRGHRAHGTSLHDEMVRVPLLVRFPTSWSLPPRRVAAPVGHIDIAPTILGAAGLEIPEDFVGLDLWDDAEGYLAPIPDRLAYSEMITNGLDLEMVSTGAEKVIRNRVFDNDGHLGRRHRTAQGDTLWRLSQFYFFDHLHTDAIMSANPDYYAEFEGPKDSPIPSGLEFAIPDREPGAWGPPFRFFDLLDDPAELRDRFEVEDPTQTWMVTDLGLMTDGMAARRGRSLRVRESELDDETLEDLKGLGYIQGNP